LEYFFGDVVEPRFDILDVGGGIDISEEVVRSASKEVVMGLIGEYGNGVIGLHGVGVDDFALELEGEFCGEV
jgi:hypothetical protein